MLWPSRFNPLANKRSGLALVLCLIAAAACADREATDPHRITPQSALKDINAPVTDDLWISPNRSVISGQTATGYLTLVNPPAAGTQIPLTPAHPNAYVVIDSPLVWPGGNTASFLVHTSVSPYQLGISTNAIVNGQWYTSKGFTLYASPPPPPPPPPARKVSATPDTLRFGAQAPNTSSAPQVVTVTNTGEEAIQVWSFAASAPFTLIDNHCEQVNLAPGISCTVSVRYSPTTSGASQTGFLTFKSGATTTPQVVLIGTPTPWINVTPTAIGWGAVVVGNGTSGRVVKITNTGTASFGVSSLTLGGANPGDFPIYTDGCTGATLTPGTSCAAYVSFEPSRIGARSATITIAHNASGGPVLVSLSGTGSKPAGGYVP